MTGQTAPEITARSWLMVLTLGLVWGATFLVIELALAGVTPLWLAAFRITFAMLLTLAIWDKAMVGKVEKAIRESGLGINPQLNGTIIMLPIPELNEERRTQLTKVAGQYAESARVSIRNVRRDGMDQIKKAKADGMSEDDQKVWEGEVQDMTNKFIAQIDEQLESKQAEIMQV